MPVAGQDDLRRLQWLRDFAIAGVALLVLLARPLFYTLVPLLPAFGLIAFWVIISIVTWVRLRRAAPAGPRELLLHISIDLFVLTALLVISGGPANPLTALFLPYVAMSAAVLPASLAGFVAILSIAAYSSLWFFSLPLTVEDADRAMQMHLVGMWLTFAVSALLIVAFIAHITAALRRREQQLAAAREQALRDERVVALGNLAAGAAHELGTPLATMAVIAGELVRDPALPDELREEVRLLSSQVVICKGLISRLTERAGIQRAEGGKGIAVDQWLRQLVERWQAQRPSVSPRLCIESTEAAPRIFVDTTLEQALLNLFNNAADVSPQDVDIRVAWCVGAAPSLQVDILDRGPGVDDDLLAQAGREFFTRRPDGTGIGLFLAHAAINRQGGDIVMTSRDDAVGGTRTRVGLPLYSLLAEGACP